MPINASEVDLEVPFRNDTLSSPIGVAAGPHTESWENLARCFGIEEIDDKTGELVLDEDAHLYAAGHATLKTMDGAGAARGRTEPHAGRIAHLGGGYIINDESSHGGDFEEYVEGLLLNALKMGKPLMISVGYDPEPIRDVIGRIQREIDKFSQSNPDIKLPDIVFELSLHHGNSDDMEKRVQAAVEAANPYDVFVKISYYDGKFMDIAKMAVDNGVKGIVGINSLGPVNSQGLLAKNPGGNSDGWVSGGEEISNISLAIAERVIRDVCIPNGIPYVAVGGVNPDTIMKFLKKGASLVKKGVGMSVQVCSHLINNGVEQGLFELQEAVREAVSKADCSTLLEYLSKCGDKEENLHEFDEFDFEAALARMRERIAESLERKLTLVKATGRVMSGLQADAIGPRAAHVVVNADVCDAAQGKHCGNCETSCPSSAVEIPSDDGETPIGASNIDPESCTGCGTCVTRCPSGAMSFVENS